MGEENYGFNEEDPIRKEAENLRIKGNSFLKLQDYWKAIKYFWKAVELEPDLARNWYFLGIAYEKVRNFEESAKFFEKAVKLDPQLRNDVKNVLDALE